MARLKTVFSDASQIPHLWAHRSQESARAAKGTLFFEGAALYSYGRHYLCGFMLGADIALINSTRYSVTTSKRSGWTRSATRHLTQYELPNLEDIRDSLIMADSGQSPRDIRKAAEAFSADALAGNSGAMNYRGASESRARSMFIKWLADNWQEARDNREGVDVIAARLGLNRSEVTSGIRKGEKAAGDLAARRCKAELARKDSDGKRVAALSPEAFRAEWPKTGNSLSRDKDYAFREAARYGVHLSRLHSRAKAKGADARAAALWGKVKAYRAWLKQYDSRIIAAHRASLAAEVRAWRNGGKRPESWRFEQFPTIKAALAKSERIDRAAIHAEAFRAWQAGEGKRPEAANYEADSPEAAAINEHKAQERAANEAAYLAWQADKSAPRPPSSGFRGYDSESWTSPSGHAYSYSFLIHNESDKAALIAERPFAFAHAELAALEASEKQEREAREKQEREAAALEAFRTRGVTSGHLSDADGGALLTVIGQELVTSWGARVPLADAIRVFRFAKLCKESGKAWHANGKRVYCGHYQIDKIMPSGGFKAGCHLINWPEVEAAAIMAGVADASADDSALQGVG